MVFVRGEVPVNEAIFEFLEYVSVAVDELGCYTQWVFSVTCRRRVNFKILMGNLKCCGVRGIVSKWLRSFLFDFHQSVVMSSHTQSGY